MEHLVEGHLGGWYISDEEPEVITRYCESCGDSDSIILSWNEGDKFIALFSYLTARRFRQEDLINDVLDGVNLEYLYDDIYYFYDCHRCLLEVLHDDQALTKKEYMIIKKQIRIVKKEQYNMIKNLEMKKLNRLTLQYKSRRVYE